MRRKGILARLKKRMWAGEAIVEMLAYSGFDYVVEHGALRLLIKRFRRALCELPGSGHRGLHPVANQERSAPE